MGSGCAGRRLGRGGRLRRIRYSTQISVDGGWGRQTEAAVREFQETEGLPVSGVLDNQTMKALNRIQAELLAEAEAREIARAAPGQ
ncbi:MAG: peptidoglycan-binding domain-containing protein [Hyphomonas sp.]